MVKRRYEVIVQMFEGRHETIIRAAQPLDAAMQVLGKLGFGENDDHHPAFALFVVPMGVRHG